MTSHSPKEMSDEDVIRTGLMPVAVEGIGRFIFKRRTFEREMRSTARYHELTGGVAAAGSQFDSLASALGDYETLVESHPPGWSVRVPELLGQQIAVLLDELECQGEAGRDNIDCRAFFG